MTPPATRSKPSAPASSPARYGVAVDPEGNLYATTTAGTQVAVFKPSSPPSPRIDNPPSSTPSPNPKPATPPTSRLTPNGDFAAFPSTLPLAGHGEESEATASSSATTLPRTLSPASPARPAANPPPPHATLAANGLSLTKHGQLFFTTTAALVSSDTDEKPDVYEWEPPGTGNCGTESPTFAHATGACLALISAGTSTFDSGLLGADADGTDAYFFTRDSLVPQDTNGPTMKVYDARAKAASPTSSRPNPARPPTSATGLQRLAAADRSRLGNRHPRQLRSGTQAMQEGLSSRRARQMRASTRHPKAPAHHHRRGGIK